MRRRHTDVAERLAGDSFLRQVDARAKLALMLVCSAAVMLPLVPLVGFGFAVSVLLVTAGIGMHALRGVMRLRWLLLLLFVADWVFVGLDLALAVTIRLALLVASAQIVLATTSPAELQRALRQLGLPERVAFSLGIAQQSLVFLQDDVRRILEAQRARGVIHAGTGAGLRERWARIRREGLAVIVPTIVVATQRAWSAHEAAAVRGFDGSTSDPMPGPRLRGRDYGWLALSLAGLTIVVWGR